VVAQLTRDQGGGPAPALQLLIYPPTDRVEDCPSMSLFAEGFMLGAEDVRRYDRQYGGPVTVDRGGADRREPTLLPLCAHAPEWCRPRDHRRGRLRSLRDEADAYATALAAAGVPVTHLRFPGLLHGFVNMSGVSRAAEAAPVKIATAVRGLYRLRPL
jgi:acetyl esterase